MRIIQIFAALALAATAAACGQAEETEAEARSLGEIEEIVRSYILENPEIIEEALIELQARARDRERQAVSDAALQNAQVLAAGEGMPKFGPEPEAATVTVVEFFDYNCGFCRVTNDWVQGVIAEHGDEVRVVLKEFPVLGAESVEAARAALAVWDTQPEAYLGFHDAMMTASGPLPSDRIDTIAQGAGVDVAAMRAAMEDESVGERISQVRALAREIGITGTPFFVIGEEVVPGADVAALERALEAALGR